MSASAAGMLLMSAVLNLMVPDPAAAQLFSPPSAQDSVYLAILPGISYNSDLGFFGAVKLNRYDFRGGNVPYRSFREFKVAGSTKGLVAAEFYSDQTSMNGTQVRTIIEAFVNRFPQDTYFGIGNQTDFDSGLWDDDYYYFTSFHAGGNLRFRIPIYFATGNRKRLDIVPGAGYGYENPYYDEMTLIETDRPAGIGGGWFNTLGIGLNWENRDSEILPTRGNHAEMRIDGSHAWLGSDFNGAILSSSLSQYAGFHVLLDHVLATRISYYQAVGDVPYWQMPALGGEYTLRGYAFRRFRDNASIFYNTEIRTWFFHHEQTGVRLGWHLFLDGGRVFKKVNVDDVVRDHHITYGFGGVISGKRRDVFLRLDIGFSDEMMRFYTGIGYMF
jgi:outer membrane protein assembly factor BamA